MKKPSINSLKHFIRATCQGTPMMEAGQLACTVLFEGLSPVNKARRAIRSILPVPPGGWDAPAKTPDGKPVISQNGNELSWNLKMEAAIRDEFFHSGDIAEKFEPGVARIAYQDLHLWPENVADFRQQQPAPRTDRIPSLKAILRMLTGAHQDDFDGDLNGLSFDTLEQNYGTHKNRNSDDYNEGSGIEDTGESKYRIVHVKNFEESEQYAHMFPDDSTRWCICRSRQYWNQYTRRGQNTAYYLIAPDAEDIPAVPGENCPLDRYGLSMIGIMIDPEGGIDHCCCRWNYAHGATDGILNRKQIEELIGRPLDKACPHLEPEEEEELTIDAVIAKIQKGMDPMEAWTACGFTSTEHTLWDGTAIIFEHPHVDDDGYETTSETIVNAKTLMPMFKFELFDWDVIDDNLIWGKYKTGETDYYGEDVYNDALLRRDGYCTDLATSDAENSDYVAFYQSRVDYIHKIDGLPGLYLLRMDDTRECDFPYAIIDSDGNSKVHMHHNIDIYPASRLICCDLESDYVFDQDLNGGDGGIAVYHYDESGNLKEYIGNSSTSDTLDFIGSTTFRIAPDPNHPEKKSGEDINIIYVDDGAIYTIIGGIEKLLFNENVTSTEKVTLKNTSDDIYRITRDAETEDGYEDEDVLYDLSQDRILATGLKEMDSEGMYTDSEGFRNKYGINGPILKKGYRHIEERVIQKSCAAGDSFYVCAESPDADEAIFIDQETNEPVYDHPVPKDAVPVTKDLYIAPLPDEADGSHKYAYFSAKDGQQTSEPFVSVRIDSGTACTTVTSKKATSRDANDGTTKIIDLATGKDYPFTLSDMSLTFFFNWPGIKAKAVQKFEEVTGEPGDDAKNSTYIYILSNANDDTRTIAACCRGVWVFSDIGWKTKLAANKNSSLVTWIDDTTKRFIVYDIATNKSIDFNSNNNAVFFLRRFVDSQGYGMSSENFALATKKYEMEHPDKTWMDWVKEYEQNEGKEYGPR